MPLFDQVRNLRATSEPRTLLLLLLLARRHARRHAPTLHCVHLQPMLLRARAPFSRCGARGSSYAAAPSAGVTVGKAVPTDVWGAP